jgi:hypothetical protein
VKSEEAKLIESESRNTVARGYGMGGSKGFVQELRTPNSINKFWRPKVLYDNCTL